MNEAGFEDKMRYYLWSECALCVTTLENIFVNENQDKSPYELLYGNKCKITKYIHTIGEFGVVKVVYNGMVSKVINKGKCMIFIGYCLNHSSGVFRMYDMDTKGIFITRDVTWLGNLFKDWKRDRTEYNEYNTNEVTTYNNEEKK